MSGSNGATVHTEECSCTRCRGFEPNNVIAVRHGAQVAEQRLSSDPRTLEHANRIRACMPLYSEADEVAIDLLAVTMVRVERAVAAIERADQMSAENPLAPYLIENGPALKSLREDVRAWIRLCSRLANDLGMTPVARSRIGLDVAMTRKALGADLVEKYGGTT